MKGTVRQKRKPVKKAPGKKGKPSAGGSRPSIAGRKKVEEALRAKDAELELILTRTPFLLTRCSRDLRYLYASHAYAQMIGRAPDQIAGRPILEIMGEEGFETIRPHVEAVLQGQLVEYEAPVHFQGLGSRLLHVIYVPDKDEQGRVIGWIASILDITERKQAEEDLRAVTAELQLTLGTAATGLTHCSRDLRYLSANLSYARLVGLSPEEIVGRPIVEVIGRKAFEAVRPYIERVLRGERVEYETEIPLATGQRVIHAVYTPSRDSSGNIAGWVASLNDITDRKRLMDQLTASRNQLQNIIDHTPALIYVFDLGERFLIANQAVAEFLGSTPKEMIGKSRHFFMPEDVAREHVANDRKVIKAGKAMEFEESGKFNGREITFLTFKFPLRDLEGKIYAVGGISLDITERKLMEDSLRTYSNKLEEAYAEIESFSYSVSHDLRAPLRAIDGFSRMLLKKHGSEFDEDSMRKFNVIRSSAQQMGQLIDDILTLSRIGRYKVSIVELDMTGIVRDIWKDLQTDIGEREIAFTVGNMPTGSGDSTLIKQVYSNLLGNAVKFTKLCDPARIEVGGRVEGNECVYYVKDNGVGFDMAYYDKLFGIFQRLHKADEFEGTGVGLATVKRVVRRHGGRAWAEGKVGEGATFYFSLPLHTHTHTHTQDEAASRRKE